MNSANTRKSFIMSCLSLLICVALLIGTTFAWFTDTATSGVNRIQSGILDIALLDENGNNIEGQTLNFIKADGSSSILWEPGCTYSLPKIYVKNNGNLALKFKLVITGIMGDAKLNEAIEWTINGLALNTEYRLGPDEMSPALEIKGHMKEDAGNEYQNLTIDGISISVYATQDTAESDSFGNDYDKDSKYTMPDFYVNNTSQLVAAINDAEPGDIIKLQAEGTYVIPSGTKDLVITGSADTVIDLTGTNSHMENVTFEGVTFECGNTSYHGYQHSNNLTFRNCTIKGTYWSYAYNTKFIGCTFINTDSENYNIWTYGSRYITFDNCTFISAGRSVLIYVEGGPGQDAVFRNCTFEATYTVADKAAIEIDSSYISGTYTVIVDNGTTATGFGNIGQVSGLINNKKGTRTTIIYNGVTVLSAS